MNDQAEHLREIISKIKSQRMNPDRDKQDEGRTQGKGHHHHQRQRRCGQDNITVNLAISLSNMGKRWR